MHVYLCLDPCDGFASCGKCAECRVVNHGAQCNCPANFLGNPLVACTQPIRKCDGLCPCDESGYCTKKCSTDNDCACGESCFERKCRAKCNKNQACAQGQLCNRGVCIPGCRSNSDCPNEESCVNRKCANPCGRGVCGKNALCKSSDHRAVCLCPDGYRGEPKVACTSYECTTDEDCESNKLCDKNGACRNPCLEQGVCGTNAQCRIVNRRAQCSCPPNYIGNPQVECRVSKLDECLRNPCGENSRCRDIPGGFECSCAPGCIGDAYKGCVCEDLCRNKPCGVNAGCKVINNTPQCYCPSVYPVGDPHIECKLILF